MWRVSLGQIYVVRLVRHSISVEVCFLKFDVYIMKWIESMFFGKFGEKQYYKIVSFEGRLKGVSQAEL